jgi:uncharacterized protein YacL
LSYVSLQSIPLFFNSADQHSSYADSSDFNPAGMRKFIPDISCLEDGRIVDLARLGLFENQLLIPHFLTKELKYLSENGDEYAKARAKRALDSIRKLETIPRLGLQFKDLSAPLPLEITEKLAHVAKNEVCSIISSDTSIKPEDPSQGYILTIDTIASSLKPPIPKGESLAIKIQRLGKEPKQGIGYLDDGTMVVVNGGGDFLGKTVRTQVLSQKYSTSGKIVFCNVRHEDEDRISPYVHADIGANSSI